MDVEVASGLRVLAGIAAVALTALGIVVAAVRWQSKIENSVKTQREATERVETLLKAIVRTLPDQQAAEVLRSIVGAEQPSPCKQANEDERHGHDRTSR